MIAKHTCKKYFRLVNSEGVVQGQYTPYQIEGVKKLASFKESFTNNGNSPLSFKASLSPVNVPVEKEKVQEFTNVFCEHLLADTDYGSIQKYALEYHSPVGAINDMDLSSLLKLLTYIIWTDKILEGYFFARIHDKTVYMILSRLEKVLMENAAAL